MDKSRILRLKRLASSLSKIEKRNFQILNGCEPNSGRASLKTIEVWNMLQSTSGSLFELSRTENGRKMIENLEQKVLDHLLMDNIIHKNAKDSPQLQLLKQAKYLLKAKLLYERGYYRKALSIATNIQKGASQLECFDLKLQAIHLKISIAVIINEYDLYSTILKEKQDCINIYNRLYNLTCIYYDLKIQYKNNALNKNSFNTIKRFIKDSIKDDDVYSCKVAQFIIEYFKLIMAKHGDEYNFKACLQNLYGLADQAILHNLISSLGEIQLEEANYFIRNRNDIKAQNLLHKCLKTSHKQGYTYVKALEKLLCVHLRNNTAHEFWESQKDNIFGFNAPFKIYQEQTTTWKFFECYIFAIQGATMKCLAKVENFLKFVKPIKEINSILRLLKIRCLIALDRYDDCDSEIESLRKFISRHGLEGFLMNHNLYEFYCILRNLKKSGYQKNINFKSYQPEPIEDLIKMNLTSLLIVKTAEHLNSWLYNGYK